MTQNHKGYTLIELIVVVALIGIMYSFTMPRFQQAILSDNLQGVVRKFVGNIKTLRSEAIREHKDFYLNFDLNSDEFWITEPGMSPEKRYQTRKDAYTLPDEVHIFEVSFPEEVDRIMGEVQIMISEKGYIQPAIIHLESDDDTEFSLILRPFLGKVEIIEDYVDYEDMQ